MRQPQRKHLMGGTLKTAMANEIKSVLTAVGGHRVTAASTLGISVRTLEKWLKHWEELGGIITNGMETVLATKPKAKKKKKAKKFSGKKKSSKATQSRATA
jgi:transposase-like protein